MAVASATKAEASGGTQECVGTRTNAGLKPKTRKAYTRDTSRNPSGNPRGPINGLGNAYQERHERLLQHRSRLLHLSFSLMRKLKKSFKPSGLLDKAITIVDESLQTFLKRNYSNLFVFLDTLASHFPTLFTIPPLVKKLRI
ncbi:hypothetical protein NC651_005637 [Populus alba x Populus x berolinensis]|nr:hypothetical protein NC651_005637 [Populus alba x Populus x berolinensis]